MLWDNHCLTPSHWYLSLMPGADTKPGPLTVTGHSKQMIPVYIKYHQNQDEILSGFIYVDDCSHLRDGS